MMSNIDYADDPRRKRDDFEDLAGEPSREDESDEERRRRREADELEDLSGEPVRDDDEEEDDKG